MRPTNSDLQTIGAQRRFNLWAGYYCIALLSVFAFLIGDLGTALVMIVVAETIAFFWRPTPQLGQSSYSGPTPAAWQTPIRVFRWSGIVYGFWTAASAVVVVTIVFVIFFAVLIVLIALRRYSLGAGNYAVAVLMGGWLLTRPAWVPPLRKALGQSTQGLRSELSPWAPAVYVSSDGYDVDFKTLIVGLVGKRHRLVHIGFPELDEVRILAWNDAAAYAESLTTYDATLTPRMVWEFSRFVQGNLPRPSVFLYSSFGMHLLLHGPSLLYLIGAGDAWAPAALAAWDAWRSPHVAPAAPQTLPQ